MNTNYNNIKILAIEDDEYIRITLSNYGTDYVLDSDTAYKKISSGWDDFDIVIIRPEMMPRVGKFRKLLGEMDIMPSPKCGTVVIEPELFISIKTVQEISKTAKPTITTFNELEKYVNTNGWVFIDYPGMQKDYVEEYQPIARYLRGKIGRAIYNKHINIL